MIKKIKNYENEIKRLQLIQEKFLQLNSISNKEAMLGTLLESSVKYSEADRGLILIKIKDTDEYKISAFENYINLNIGDVININSIKDKLIYLNQPLILEEIDKVLITSDEDIINSQAIFPLNAGSKLLGILVLESKKVDFFTDLQLVFVQILSDHVAQHLDRIILCSDMEQKIILKNVLLEITNSIEKVFVLKDVFDVVMKKLADKFYILRGMLVLFNKNDMNKLSIFSAYNLTEDEISRGIYKVGEGVVGRVVEYGKAISIPDINKDNLFLNRMKIKREKKTPISFIAVPIKISGITVGVLAVEKKYESMDFLKDEEDMLFLVSGIIANKVKIYQKMSEEKSILLKENLSLKQELFKNYGIKNIIGKNKKMLEIFELIKMVAESNSSILVLGDSGTGKELVAKSLHFNSERRYAPFISVNCAAIPENLLESELFGYKKGAFTGAGSDKKGKFVLADGGTLFLDEIGDMSLYLQAKLLRAIQDKVIEPVGSEIRVELDIRIISATNKNPKELIKNGKLREDLYYRLNVVEIKLPPLKDRKEDIPLLVQFFIEKYSKNNKKDVNGISPEAMRILQLYHWPGNVRQLENVIERAVLLSKGNYIEADNLPEYIIEAGDFGTEELSIKDWIENFVKNEPNFGLVYEDFMKIFEKELLTKSFLLNNRNKVKTSDFLGINRNTLRTKMEKYKINL